MILCWEIKNLSFDALTDGSLNMLADNPNHGDTNFISKIIYTEDNVGDNSINSNFESHRLQHL